jgi:hypothetical protein
MKQTAVEFLVEQIKQNVHNSVEEFELLVEQAKEMEKEIICTAYLEGIDDEYTTSEQYYNETFKSE